MKAGMDIKFVKEIILTNVELTTRIRCVGDQFEQQAIARIFGREDMSAAVAVSSTKGATGAQL